MTCSLVLGQGVGGITDLFDLVVYPGCFTGVQLEAGPRLYAAERGLIENLRAPCIIVARNIVHDLERWPTCGQLSVMEERAAVNIIPTGQVEIHVVMSTFADRWQDV